LRAVVFSGGGAFGAYHAGVWRALEERGFRPDIVAGTSIGAIQATAVARGCPAAQIEEWWRDPQSNVFRWNWPPRSLGFFDQQKLHTRLAQAVQEFPKIDTRIKLLVTLTELPSTRIRALADAGVTDRCLLASAALPFAYAPVKIARRWYCDGGVFCRLPVAAAIAAGATEIITVDLLAAPPSQLLRAFMAAAVSLREALLREPDIAPVLDQPIRMWPIGPSFPLGRLRDSMRWNLANVNRWIDCGYADATEFWEARERASQTSKPQAASTRIENVAPR